MIYDPPPDGQCFFYCICHQLLVCFGFVCLPTQLRVDTANLYRSHGDQIDTLVLVHTQTIITIL